MKINDSTELMTNQKHAIVLPPDKQFKVLQTQGGNALFFSIGHDDTFYCTREVQGDTHGWSRLDISTGLGGIAKAFDIAQDLTSQTINMIAVITKDGKDYLHTSLNNTNTDDAWDTNELTWTAVPFDDSSNDYAGLPIADVYIAQTGDTKYIVADIITDATLQTISRYFVDPEQMLQTGCAWIAHDLSGNLQADKVTNAIGCRPHEDIAGIYTLGSIAGEAQLLYTPLFNETDPGGAPSPTILKLPAGVSPENAVMALSSRNPPFTDVFIAGESANGDPATGSLYFLGNALQTNESAPVCIYTHNLLLNTQKLHVNNWNGRVVVWGLNGLNQSFIMECSTGSETEGLSENQNSTAWSCPMPILFDVVNITTFLNNQRNNSIIFAHMQDGTLLQLSEDVITTAWQERSILIPASGPEEVYEISTYTTHIEFTDDNNVIQQNIPVAITSTGPCNVYINDVYCTLDTTVPLQVQADNSGVITIVQPVDSIGGICYTVSAGGSTRNVNPLTNTNSRLQHVKSGADLNVNVTDEYGNTTPLVDTGISDTLKDSVASNMAQINATSASLPEDGSIQDIPPSLLLAANMQFNGSRDKIFGISFIKDKTGHFEGLEAMAKLGVILHSDHGLMFSASSGLQSYSSGSIEAKAGHIFRWVKKEASKVEQVVVTVIKNDVNDIRKDINHFFITIAGEVYHFVIKCLNDLVNSLHTLLHTLAVAFKDVIKWIGFIFNYGDILRTHNVIKNLVIQQVTYYVNNITSLKANVQTVFDTIENDINKLVKLPQISDTPQSTSGKNPPPASTKTPQSNWGTHQLKSNGTNANGGNFSPTNTGDDPTSGRLDALQDLINNEKNTISNMLTQLRSVIDNFQKLTVSQLIEQILAIIADFVIDEAKDLLLLLADVVAYLSKTIINTLTAPIDIPVISWLYKKISGGNEFTILDLVCLITAIPATIVYKIAEGKAPFPDNDTTKALINAPDFETIKNILFQPVSSGNEYALNATSSQTNYDVIVKVCNVTALFGSIGVDICTTLKSGLINGLKDKKSLIVANGCCSFLFMLPCMVSSIPTSVKSGQPWFVYANNTFTWAGVAKIGVDTVGGWGFKWSKTWDKVSPAIDCILNIAWQVSTMGNLFDAANKDSNNAIAMTSDIIDYVGGTAFDLGGICSPMLSAAQDTNNSGEGKLDLVVMLAIISGLNLVWGSSCVLDSFGPFKH